MNTSCYNTTLVKIALMGFLVCALGAYTPARAQDEGPPQAAGDSGAELAQRVKAALRADRDISDKHIDVSVEKGKIVLRGFVSDDADRRKALRIARDAADGQKIVDDIELNLGGR